MILRNDTRQRSLFLFQSERGQRNSSAMRQALEARILEMLGRGKDPKDHEWNTLWGDVIVSQTERSLQVSAKSPGASQWLEKNIRYLVKSVAQILDEAAPMDDMSLEVGLAPSDSRNRMKWVIPTLVVRTPKANDAALWAADSCQSPDAETIKRWEDMIKEDIFQWHCAFNPLHDLENQVQKDAAKSSILDWLDLKIESPGKAMPLKGALYKSNGHHVTPLARLGVVISTGCRIKNMHVGKLQGLGFGRVVSSKTYIDSQMEYPIFSPKN